MPPEIPPDTSTLVALTGLVAFFVCLVFLWIIGFRRYANRMVTTTAPAAPAAPASPASPAETQEEHEPVRVVDVPIAGAVDGGPLLGGRVMRIADRDTGQRRTVRQMIDRMIDRPIAPPPATSTPPEPIPVGAGAPGIPDETPPQDISQQQTQVLPALPRRLLRRQWVLHPMVSPVDVPHDHLN